MKIIGIICVGPREYERYLEETLKDKTKLCDKIIVLGDGLKEKRTLKLCQKFNNVEYYETSKKLFNTEQWKLKQTALWLAREYNPDWILAFDADELMDYRINRQELEKMASRNVNSYWFRFVHLWNDRNHYRTDYGWRGLDKIIFYRYRPEEEQKFVKRALHCGLAPKYAHKNSEASGYIVKHLGYMKPAHRPAKVRRYQKYDPIGFYKPLKWYRSIKNEGDIKVFNEQEFVKTISTL